MSKNIYKGSFIQFSTENTRVIDTDSLVKKRIESYNGVLRERAAHETPTEDIPYDESGLSDDELSALTDNPDAFSEEGFEAQPEEPEEHEPTPEEIKQACDAMIDEANAQALSVLKHAEKDAEELKQKAAAEGREQGYNEGMASAASEIEAMRVEFEQKTLQLENEYEDLVRQIEPKMVETITGVYASVFGNGFYDKKDVLSALISKALSRTEPDDKIVIHVSSEDYELINGAKDELFARFSFASEPEIRQRDSLKSGEAKVETSYGIMDCGVDTELKELTRMLTILSHEDGR